VGLDGSNDEFTAPNDFQFGHEDFTVWGVMKTPKATANDEWLISGFNLSSQRSYAFGFENDRFYGILSDDGLSSVQYQTTATVAADTYYFCSYTYDSVNEDFIIRVYNTSGSLVEKLTSSLPSGFTLHQTTQPVLVGALSSGLQRSQLTIDQMVVLNKVVTDAEVVDWVNSGNGLNHRDLDGTETFYSNIVAWYDFNDPSVFGKNFLSEATYIKPSNGGVNDLVTTDTDTSLKFAHNQAFSYRCRFLIEDVTAASQVLYAIGDGATGFYAYVLTDGRIRISLRGTGITRKEFDANIQNNTIYDTVFTYNGNGDISGLKLYVDSGSGFSEVGFSGSVNTGTAINYSVYKFTSGQFSNGTFEMLGNSFIDLISCWDTEISSANVTALEDIYDYDNYTAGNKTNLIHHWDFDDYPATVISDKVGSINLPFSTLTISDYSGDLWLNPVSISSSNAVLGHISGKAGDFTGVTRWTDRSTNGNDASQSTITAIPLWKENVLNTTEDVIEFDGGTTARWLDIPTNTGYMDGVTDKPYTWCFLFKMDELRNNNFLLGENTNPYSWYWYINSSGTLVLRSFDKSVNAYKATTVSAGFPAFPAETWTFLAVTYSSTNEFIVYKDAIDVSDVSGTVGAYVAMEDLPVRLGNYAGSSNNTFKGQIAQTKYFEKELTQDEVTLIKDYYNEKYGLSL
jgi:hypothetical protein